jgi:hypothetical protein
VAEGRRLFLIQTRNLPVRRPCKAYALTQATTRASARIDKHKEGSNAARHALPRAQRERETARETGCCCNWFAVGRCVVYAIRHCPSAKPSARRKSGHGERGLTGAELPTIRASHPPASTPGAELHSISTRPFLPTPVASALDIRPRTEPPRASEQRANTTTIPLLPCSPWTILLPSASHHATQSYPPDDAQPHRTHWLPTLPRLRRPSARRRLPL